MAKGRSELTERLSEARSRLSRVQGLCDPLVIAAQVQYLSKVTSTGCMATADAAFTCGLLWQRRCQ